jgi:hypothetical protein
MALVGLYGYTNVSSRSLAGTHLREETLEELRVKMNS